jgi:hypothetical protein
MNKDSQVWKITGHCKTHDVGLLIQPSVVDDTKYISTWHVEAVEMYLNVHSSVFVCPTTEYEPTLYSPLRCFEQNPDCVFELKVS